MGYTHATIKAINQEFFSRTIHMSGGLEYVANELLCVLFYRVSYKGDRFVYIPALRSSDNRTLRPVS